MGALPVSVDERALQVDSKDLSAFMRASFSWLDPRDLLEEDRKKERKVKEKKVCEEKKRRRERRKEEKKQRRKKEEEKGTMRYVSGDELTMVGR